MPDPQSLSQRKTKIIATVGPACDDVATLEDMIHAGLNVVRLNLSHGDYESHANRVAQVRQAASNVGAHVAIMVDTKGIEVRTGLLEDGPVFLEADQTFTLFADDRKGNLAGVSVSYRKLSAGVKEGDVILLDDGAIELRVAAVNAAAIECVVVHGGMLGERKGVNLPGAQLAISAISPEFLENLENEIDFAVAQQVDYMAASFVQSGSEIQGIRDRLNERGSNIPIIAKIENQAGVDNVEAIVAAADGIMVARGDLGVELPLAEVPSTQKKLIQCSVTNGKPAVTATQMLASMETNPKPTRAEASDVANAILDGISAVMLSGETAVGQYPVVAIQTMSAIALRAEASLREFGFLQTIRMTEAAKIAEAIGQAAARLAEQLQAAAIITLTDSGYTARLISRHRPESLILAVTASDRVARRLAMNWGVIPLLYDEENADSDESRTRFGCGRARELGLLETGDVVVITHGTQQGAGGTDLIRVLEID